MESASRMTRWTTYALEAGWLLAVALVPLYFNLLSARHFEPDKISVLRGLVLLMAAVALIRAAEQWRTRRATAPPGEHSPPLTLGGIWRWLTSVPLLLPMLFYALVFLFTTATSVVPHTSFWGSYQRLQGTYTHLSYITLAIIVLTTMRQRAQLERFITVALLAGLGVAGYGILQHYALDPLNWGGDVVSRVASTMGNSIFVAAYLIMLVPLALFRVITTATAARNAPTSDNPTADVGHAIARLLLIGGTLALLLAMLKFGGAVRVNDLRYWWVMPAAIAVATALWTLLFHRPTANTARRLPMWQGGLFIAFLLLFALTFVRARLANVQDIVPAANTTDWWLWLMGAIIAVGGHAMLVTGLPAPPAPPSRLARTLDAAGWGVLTLALLATILFSQSRGPWIGLGAGLFVGGVVLLLLLARRAPTPTAARRLRWLLGGWVALTVAVGLFLVVFNLSNAPVFVQLREAPYIGRMGQLLAVDSGTGKVRVLIWGGDAHAGGVRALILSDPVRSVIGWGPESMFVAFNQHYPPTLATLESRGASPDRSHQAILDELVTKGVLGLASYFFVVLSFYSLVVRLLRGNNDWYWQVWSIALLASMTTHLVEGLTGIPIVATLMLFWLLQALAVSTGSITGQLTVGTPAPAPAAPAPARKPARTQTTRTPAAGVPPLWLGAYSLLLLVALAAAWWFNINTVYADMRFSEGEAIAAQDFTYEAQLVAAERFIASINSNPREDHYYLSLARSLMTLSEYARQARGGNPGDPAAAPVDLDDVLRLPDALALQGFVERNSPTAIMQYAEAAMLHARDLNPRNKDHYANLGRLHSFWATWHPDDPTYLDAAAAWLAQAHAIAPQDVTLLTEHADTLIERARVAARNGDMPTVQQSLAEAEHLLQRAATLDDGYWETARLRGDIAIAYGDTTAATSHYRAAIALAPTAMLPYADTMPTLFADDPARLQELATAYTAAASTASDGDAPRYTAAAGQLAAAAGDSDTALHLLPAALAAAPDNVPARLAYARVLSDTGQYRAALEQAEQGLTAAQQTRAYAAEQLALSDLIAYLRGTLATRATDSATDSDSDSDSDSN